MIARSFTLIDMTERKKIVLLVPSKTAEKPKGLHCPLERSDRQSFTQKENGQALCIKDKPAFLVKLARRKGFEPPTFWFVVLDKTW